MAKQILIVVTNHQELGCTGEKTGLWLDEFAAPYYIWQEEGFRLTVASLLGGASPVDPKSLEPAAQTLYTRRYQNEKHPVLLDTASIEAIKPEEFDAVFYPGGHGPLWDLAVSPENSHLLETFYHAGKRIAAVCHGPAGLLGAKRKDGKSILHGEKISAFSDQEENLVKLEWVVPFSLEQRIRAVGAIYCSGEPWKPYAVCSGPFVTGQNPASAELVAARLAVLLHSIP